MWVDQLPDHAIVVFDGWCGFCTRCVRLLARLDRHGRLELLAAQRDGVPERAAVTLDDAAAAAWTLAPGGVRASGAGAIGLRSPWPPAPGSRCCPGACRGCHGC